MCSDNSGPWKLIPLSLLSNVGGTLLFQCNYDLKYLCINEHLPKFYRDLLIHWQELNCTTPKDKEDILNQIIWNDCFIPINNSSVYYRIWNQVCICKLACLVNDIANSFCRLKRWRKNLKLDVIFCATLACCWLYLISGKKA